MKPNQQEQNGAPGIVGKIARFIIDRLTPAPLTEEELAVLARRTKQEILENVLYDLHNDPDVWMDAMYTEAEVARFNIHPMDFDTTVFLEPISERLTENVLLLGRDFFLNVLPTFLHEELGCEGEDPLFDVEFDDDEDPKMLHIMGRTRLSEFVEMREQQ